MLVGHCMASLRENWNLRVAKWLYLVQLRLNNGYDCGNNLTLSWDFNLLSCLYIYSAHWKCTAFAGQTQGTSVNSKTGGFILANMVTWSRRIGTDPGPTW